MCKSVRPHRIPLPGPSSLLLPHTDWPATFGCLFAEIMVLQAQDKRAKWCNAQGKTIHLGTFADPISAAIRYDREATKLQGANAVLNFPTGCTQSQNYTDDAGQAHVVPVSGETGQKVPSTKGSLPADNAGANSLPVRGAKVSLASYRGDMRSS